MSAVAHRDSWLTSVESAQRVLAQVESVDEAAHLVDEAETAKVYARNVLRSQEAQNHAAHVSLLCQRRAGELLGSTAKQNGARRPDSVSARPLRYLLGTETDAAAQQLSSRWQRVAAIPVEAFEAHVEKVIDQGHELTTAGVLRAVGSVIQSSETNEWYTPARYIEAARTVLGGIDLDPASNDAANETVGAQRYYTATDDGLAVEWHGRVWLNPPYGRLAGTFVQRLVDEYDAGNVTAAVALVNAHCTDTAWFQSLWDHALCFTDHRINFAAGTEARSGSTHGSVFAYLGPDRDVFASTFAVFGAVVTRWAA